MPPGRPTSRLPGVRHSLYRTWASDGLLNHSPTALRARARTHFPRKSTKTREIKPSGGVAFLLCQIEKTTQKPPTTSNAPYPNHSPTAFPTWVGGEMARFLANFHHSKKSGGVVTTLDSGMLSQLHRLCGCVTNRPVLR